ncbi:MAG TPA: hypothetical protein VMI54_25680 [Polyangiaceae bacterium]|nr:hypothetical protein [Polyangiaceae bacterium]
MKLTLETWTSQEELDSGGQRRGEYGQRRTANRHGTQRSRPRALSSGRELECVTLAPRGKLGFAAQPGLEARAFELRLANAFEAGFFVTAKALFGEQALAFGRRSPRRFGDASVLGFDRGELRRTPPLRLVRALALDPFALERSQRSQRKQERTFSELGQWSPAFSPRERSTHG